MIYMSLSILYEFYSKKQIAINNSKVKKHFFEFSYLCFIFINIYFYGYLIFISCKEYIPFLEGDAFGR